MATSTRPTRVDLGEMRSIRRRRPKVSVNLPGMLTVIVLVALWQLAVVAGWLTYQFLPAPSAIGGALVELVQSGQLPTAVWHTVSAALMGWGIACAVGIGVGLVMGLLRVVWRYGMSTVEVLRAVPAISLIPAVVLIFGFSLTTEITIITYVCCWPVLIATIAGVGQVTIRHEDVARQLQLSWLARLQKIILPAGMGEIIVAMRLALSLALALAVVSEMIGNPAGVGYEMILAQQAIRSDAMFAYIVVIGLLAIAFNGVFVGLTLWLFPGLARVHGDET
jgi:sulfonate transport system permease protein